jgi:ADP-L-glycero-D-manno-heptose 6-epimerase
MNILVMGGSGFVGSNLAARLVELGHNVYSTSSGGGNDPKGKVLYRTATGLPWNLLPSHIDCVYYQSANNDTLCCDRIQMMYANMLEPLQVIGRLYEEHECRHFIYASSTATYGSEPAPYVEDLTEQKPLNVYGESKKAMEQAIGQLDHIYRDATFIGFRYCNVYGPGEEYKGRRASMIHQMIRHKLMGRKVKLFTDGNQRRDWVHVQDVVDANLLALTYDHNDVFNLGSGKPASFLELAGWIGNEVEWIECPFADSYQDFTCCDLTKIGNRLGYAPKRFPETAIPDYYRVSEQGLIRWRSGIWCHPLFRPILSNMQIV